MQPADILKIAALFISRNEISTASEFVEREYPFETYVKSKPAERFCKDTSQPPLMAEQRKYTQKQALQLYTIDGFIDRYSGSKLVCPSALYAISTIIPEAFPCGEKRSDTHQAFWDLFPSLDHLVPVSGGGKDIEENWITTSMTKNLKKSNISLDELNWSLHPKGNIEQWDGLAAWYMDWSSFHSSANNIRFNKGWHSAMTSIFPRGPKAA